MPIFRAHRLWQPAAMGLWALAGLGACSGIGPNGSPSGPQISLNAPLSDIIGDHIDLQVAVTGCSRITSLSLLNGQTPIKVIPVGPSPISFSVVMSEIPFPSAGIPANLSLSAKVTCDDGRTNTSAASAVRFFPAARVFQNADGSQVVPDIFYAESSGAGVSFVGCALQANGAQELVRVNTAGQVLQSNTNPQIPCDDSTWFADHAAGGVRWAVAPGIGAWMYDLNLNSRGLAEYDAGSSLSPIQPLFLGVGPDGDAIVVGPGDGGPNSMVYRVPHDGIPRAGSCTPNVWCAPTGLPQSPPFVDPTGTTVSMVVSTQDATQGTVVFQAVHFNYGDGGATTDTLKTVPYPQLGPEVATLNPSGALAFLPYDSPTNSAVYSVTAVPTGTNNATAQWVAQNLAGTPEAVLLSGDGTYVAAVAGERTSFLSVDAGVTLGTLAPGAGLVTTAVQPGLGADFYVLNGQNGMLTTEIVATDSPANGELYRYGVPGASVSVAIDASGQVWLRVGNLLVQALSTAQYRQLRGP